MHFTHYHNTVTWKVIRDSHCYSIIYSSMPMLCFGLPSWWIALIVVLYLFYRLTPADDSGAQLFDTLIVIIGILTAAVQAVSVWYILRKERKLGDYLYLDLDSRTIELPRSHMKSCWGDKLPVFYLDHFESGGYWVCELNVELDGQYYPILHSSQPLYGKIIKQLRKLGFTVQKRDHKDN